jgi:hypothetical protein
MANRVSTSLPNFDSVFRKSIFVDTDTGCAFKLPLPLVTGAPFSIFSILSFYPGITKPILCQSAPRAAEEDDTPDLSGFPESSRGLFVFLCWSLFIGVWISALVAPVFMVVCIAKGWWDGLLTFMLVWLAGGLLGFPHFPRFAEVVTSGIESWFTKFKIHHEHTSKTSTNKPTIYCYHPHGLFSIGAGLLAANLVRRGEKVSLVTSGQMRWFNPILKLLLDMAGIDIVGASPSEVRAAMAKGDRSLILVIGGYEEAVMTKDGEENIFINSRLGFVKYAMRYNYTLTPVYAFGENDLYECWDVAKGFRNVLASWKIPIVFFRGDSWFPLFPIKTDEGMKIVVGEPVHVTAAHTREPTPDQLAHSHQEYVSQLVQLYDRNNENTNRKLMIH